MPAEGERSYPGYRPMPETQPMSFSWPDIDWSKIGTAANVSAAGYGTEAFAQIAQGILAAKRARAVGAYNAETQQANALAAAQAAELEALQYERQAAIARQDQTFAHQAQLYREARAREQEDRITGQTRAIIASSGLMLSGSPLVAMESNIRQMEMDRLAQRYQTDLAIRASGEQATQAEYGATLARYTGAERLRVGKAGAALTRAQIDESGTGAGLLRAGSSLVKGATAYSAITERQKSLLSES